MSALEIIVVSLRNIIHIHIISEKTKDGKW